MNHSITQNVCPATEKRVAISKTKTSDLIKLEFDNLLNHLAGFVETEDQDESGLEYQKRLIDTI